MNFTHYEHVVLVIGKHTDVFQRDFSGGGTTWENLFMEGKPYFSASFKRTIGD